jgi:hypothetical protein
MTFDAFDFSFLMVLSWALIFFLREAIASLVRYRAWKWSAIYTPTPIVSHRGADVKIRKIRMPTTPHGARRAKKESILLEPCEVWAA